MRYNSPSLISRRKEKEITSVAWFNCKQKVKDRVTPPNITCWLWILDKITTKDFLMQDMLAPWPSGRRDNIFGVYLSR